MTTLEFYSNLKLEQNGYGTWQAVLTTPRRTKVLKTISETDFNKIQIIKLHYVLGKTRVEEAKTMKDFLTN